MASVRTPRPGRVLVVTPTYDEVENLAATVSALRASGVACDILVVDDASPDGTGEIADRLAAADPAVRVLHRTGKEGLGVAYEAGFAWGLARSEYAWFVEMDADGSHRPNELRRLRNAAHSADLVIGSRWVRGGRVLDWPWHRRFISRSGTAYARAMLRLPVHDATAGFRLYRRRALETVQLERVQSFGYVFQVELVYRALRAGLRVVEVPIEFVEREHGDSKMTPEVARESLVRITRWGLTQRLGRAQRG